MRPSKGTVIIKCGYEVIFDPEELLREQWRTLEVRLEPDGPRYRAVFRGDHRPFKKQTLYCWRHITWRLAELVVPGIDARLYDLPKWARLEEPKRAHRTD